MSNFFLWSGFIFFFQICDINFGLYYLHLDCQRSVEFVESISFFSKVIISVSLVLVIVVSSRVVIVLAVFITAIRAHNARRVTAVIHHT